MDAIQQLQEEEYDFPYHYLPDRKDGALRAFQYWGWGMKYAVGIDLIMDLVGAEPFDSLVDVGCGDGRLLREVAERFPEADMLGVDYSEHAVRLARGLNPGLDYRAFDVYEDDLGRTYDVILLSEVLEHIPLPEAPRFVEGLARMAHADTRLVVTVPHANQKLNPKHYRHFTSDSLGEALAPHFEVDEWVFFDQPSRMMALAQRLMYNKLFVLNHGPALRAIERLYRRRYLHTDEAGCFRLGAVARPAR